MDSLNVVLGLAGVHKSDSEKEKLAEKKNDWFVESIMAIKPDEIFPGVKELLTELKGRGLRIGLASSSKNAKTVIRLLEIERFFDTMVDGTMVGHSKPDPEIFLTTAKRLGVSPANCLVFEDAEAGIEAAISGGMKCVGVGYPEILKRADIVIRNTGDFDLKNLDTL
jgi:beta-phosphoglucomutase